MPTPERRFLNLSSASIDSRSLDSAAGQPGAPKETGISGYGLVFWNESDPAGTQFELWPGVIERFLPGCCNQTVRDDDVLCLFNHDPSWPLGRTRAGTMQLTTDAFGLRYQTRLPCSPVGQTVAEAIVRRDVTGSSVGMDVLERTIREEGDVVIREITRIRLLDVGPVTFPAYSSTSSEIDRRSIDEFRARQLAEARTRQARQVRVRRWLFLHPSP